MDGKLEEEEESSTEKFCEAVHAGRKSSYLKGTRLAIILNNVSASRSGQPTAQATISRPLFLSHLNRGRLGFQDTI